MSNTNENQNKSEVNQDSEMTSTNVQISKTPTLSNTSMVQERRETMENDGLQKNDVQQNVNAGTVTNVESVALDAKSITATEALGERTCWICFATEEDNRVAAWVQPCKCRGTTKWVHQSCLYRWVDEKQKGNALRPVTCQQCQTEYIIVFPQMGTLANVLETVDNLIKRISPFLAAGIFVGSIYWTAVTYGAVTFLQIVGHKNGLALMENGDPLVLLIGLPAIPVGLVLGRLIRWEDAVLRLIRNRNSVARKFPLMNLIIPFPEDEEDQISQNPATPSLSDPVSATRIFCGALLLPTISTIVGRLLFDSIENTLHRTLLGGLTYITVKGILKIYLKQQQYSRKKKRHIVDYTDDNVRTYANRNNTRHNAHSTAAANTNANANANANAAQAVPEPAVISNAGAQLTGSNAVNGSRDSIV